MDWQRSEQSKLLIKQVKQEPPNETDYDMNDFQTESDIKPCREPSPHDPVPPMVTLSGHSVYIKQDPELVSAQGSLKNERIETDAISGIDFHSPIEVKGQPHESYQTGSDDCIPPMVTISGHSFYIKQEPDLVSEQGELKSETVKSDVSSAFDSHGPIEAEGKDRENLKLVSGSSQLASIESTNQSDDVKHEPELMLESEELPEEHGSESNPIAQNNDNQAECTCKICGETFPRKLLLKHMRGHKPVEEPQFACSFCDKKLKTKQCLVSHERCHTNEHPFKCKFCPKTFKTQSPLTGHERIHTGEKPYPCKVCDKTFRWLSSLKTHYEAAHGTTMENPTQPSESINAYKCDVEGCDFTASKRAQLGHHKAWHRMKYHCTSCSKRFPNGTQLKIHEVIHAEKNFHCEQCSKSFRTKTCLANHMAVHNNDRPFLCKICGKSYVVKQQLKRHLKKSIECQSADQIELLNPKKRLTLSSDFINETRASTQETTESPKQYKCAVEGCDFVTESPFRHANHKARHELRFPCTLCPKRFPNGRQLRVHQVVHTGAKDFRCEQCSKSFRYKNSMLFHMASHNSIRDRFECKTCGKSFAQKGNLKIHLSKNVECQNADQIDNVDSQVPVEN